MNRRATIIDMLARHRSKGNEAERRRIVRDLGELSTELLMWLLDDNQLVELRQLERDGR